MRISDWSSDVCSSDLHQRNRDIALLLLEHAAGATHALRGHRRLDSADHRPGDLQQGPDGSNADNAGAEEAHIVAEDARRPQLDIAERHLLRSQQWNPNTTRSEYAKQLRHADREPDQMPTAQPREREDEARQNAVE